MKITSFCLLLFSILFVSACGSSPPIEQIIGDEGIFKEVMIPEGEYVVMKSVKIEPEGKLVISPGVVLTFGEEGGFAVSGVIIAVGNQADPIVFTALDEDKGWQNILISGEKASQSKFSYCEFSYGFGIKLDESMDSKTKGGGLCIESASPKFDNCSFTYNKADVGAGVFLNESKSEFTNCKFNNNVGDGVYLERSESLFGNCEFIANSGCGIFSGKESAPVINESKLMENQSSAIKCMDSEPSFKNSTIEGNSSKGNGGAAFVSDKASPRFENCKIINNTAAENGGGVYSEDSSPEFLLCKIQNNKAKVGGGVYFDENSMLNIKETTISGNEAEQKGGIFYITDSEKEPIFEKSKIEKNTPDNGYP